jgi:hypothetical protein
LIKEIKMENRVVDERKLRLVQDIVSEILGEGFTVTITANSEPVFTGNVCNFSEMLRPKEVAFSELAKGMDFSGTPVKVELVGGQLVDSSELNRVSFNDIMMNPEGKRTEQEAREFIEALFNGTQPNIEAQPERETPTEREVSEAKDLIKAFRDLLDSSK